VADKVDLAERFVFLDHIMMIDRQGVGFLGVGGVVPHVPDELAERVLNGIDWDPALRSANSWYDRLTAALRVKDRPARQKQLDEIEQELKTLRAKLGDAESVVKTLAADKQSPEARGKLVGD